MDKIGYTRVLNKIGYHRCFTCEKVLLHRTQTSENILLFALRRPYGPCDTPSSYLFILHMNGERGKCFERGDQQYARFWPENTSMPDIMFEV